MSTYRCSKCNKVLEEIGIPPQIQMLQMYKQVVNIGATEVPEEIKNDPYLYKGFFCPNCNKAFCPQCSHLQSEICPECGQRGLMPAYRPLLNKIAQPPQKSTIAIKEQSAERKQVGCWVWPVLVIGSLLFIAGFCLGSIIVYGQISGISSDAGGTVSSFLGALSCFSLSPLIIGLGFLGISIFTLLRKGKPQHSEPLKVSEQHSTPSEIGKAKAKSNEHYMLKCIDCGFTYHIPRDVTDHTVAFSVDVDEVEMACIYGGGAFTVTLNVKEFFTITNVPESHQVLHVSIGDNMKALHSHILSHNDPLFLIIQQSSNRTTHQYRKHPEGNTYVKFSKEHGVDIVGNINVSKAEIPGVSQ